MFRTTQMLRQQSRQLVRASIDLIWSTKHETNRSHEILREAQRAVARGRGDYDWDVEISVHELLLAFPPQGGWMLPPERYKRILNDLFDNGTTLIQERINTTEDGELLDWLVRLTPRGMIEWNTFSPPAGRSSQEGLPGLT